MTVDIFANGESDKAKGAKGEKPSCGFDWFERNFVNPAVNGGLVSTVNGAIELASLATNDKNLCKQKWEYRKTDTAEAGSLEFWTQSAGNLVGSLFAYAASSKIVGGGLRKVGTKFETSALDAVAKSSLSADAKFACLAGRAINNTTRVFGSDHTAQIIGGTLVDGTREIKPGETDYEHLSKQHFGNLIGGFVGNAVYEGGNWGAGKVKIASSLPIVSEIARIPVRAVTGFVGNAANSALSQKLGEDKLSAEQVSEAGASGAAFNTLLPYAHKLLGYGTKILTRSVPTARYFAGENLQSQVTKDLVTNTSLTQVKEAAHAHADSGSKTVAWPLGAHEATKAHELMHAYTKKDIATLRVRNAIQSHIEKGEFKVAQAKYLDMRVNGEIAARKAEEHVRNGDSVALEKLIRHDYQTIEPDLYQDVMSDPKYRSQFLRDFENLKLSKTGKSRETDYKPDTSVMEIIDRNHNVLFSGEYASVKDAIQAAIKQGNSLRRVQLINEDLSGIDFRGADMRDAYFLNSNFTGANLEGVDLSGAYMSTSSFDHALLNDAKLGITDYRDCIESAKFDQINLIIGNKSDGAEIFSAKCRTPKEAIEAAAKAKVSLENAFLAGLDLADVDLSNMNLQGAYLGKTSLWRAKLKGANLRDACFENASLREADLEDAQLENADFTTAQIQKMRLNVKQDNQEQLIVADYDNLKWIIRDNHGEEMYAELAKGARQLIQHLSSDGRSLENADLAGMNLAHTNILNTNFTNANLVGADLRGVNPIGMIFDGAKLNDARFNVVQLYKGVLNKAEFEKLHLEITENGAKHILFEGKFKDAREAVFKAVEQKVFLQGALLNGLDLSGLTLDDADFSRARLREVNFRGSSLKGADFRNALMQDANFSGSDLQGADFSNSLIGGADFLSADLRNANFTDAMADHVSMVGANLQGAVLESNNFQNAIFNGADFTNCKFMESKFVNSSFVGAKGIHDLILHEDKKSLLYHPLDLLPEEIAKSFANSLPWEQVVALKAWKACINGASEDIASWPVIVSGKVNPYLLEKFDNNYQKTISKLEESIRRKHYIEQARHVDVDQLLRSLPAEVTSKLNSFEDDYAMAFAWKNTLEAFPEYEPDGSALSTDMAEHLQAKFERQRRRAEKSAQDSSEKGAFFRSRSTDTSEVLHCMPTSVIQPHHAKLLKLLANPEGPVETNVAILSGFEPSDFRAALDAISDFSEQFKDKSLREIKQWYKESPQNVELSRWAIQLAQTFRSKTQITNWLKRTAKLGISQHDACYWLPFEPSRNYDGLGEYLLKYMPSTDKKPEQLPCDELLGGTLNNYDYQIQMAASESWRHALQRHPKFAAEWFKAIEEGKQNEFEVPMDIYMEFQNEYDPLVDQKCVETRQCMQNLHKVAGAWHDLKKGERKLSPTEILELLDTRLYPNVRHVAFARECHSQTTRPKDFAVYESRYIASLDTPSPFPLEMRWTSGDLIGRFLPRDDSRGVWLGRHTDCCQYPKAAGESCAWYGQESPNSGFFVVEDAQGRVVAQSWAWVSDDGGLCFDNIEASQGAIHKQKDGILDIYNRAAGDLSNQFHTITVGANSSKLLDGTWEKAEQDLALPSDYSGYNDSQKDGQYLLAHNPAVPRRLIERGDTWIRGALDTDLQSMKEIESRCYPAEWRTLSQSDGDYGIVLQSKDGIIGYAVVDTDKRYIADIAVLEGKGYRSQSKALIDSLLNYMRRFPGEWTADCREGTSMKLLELYAKRGRLKILEKTEEGRIGDDKRYAVRFKLEELTRDQLVVPPLLEYAAAASV